MANLLRVPAPTQDEVTGDIGNLAELHRRRPTSCVAWLVRTELKLNALMRYVELIRSNRFHSGLLAHLFGSCVLSMRYHVFAAAVAGVLVIPRALV